MRSLFGLAEQGKGRFLLQFELEADRFAATISISGDYMAEELASVEVEVTLSSSGNATIRVSDRLRAGWRIAVQVVGCLALILVGQLLLNTIVAAFAGSRLSEAGPVTRQVAAFLLKVVTPFAVLAVTWAAGRFLDKRPLADFGFYLNGAWWIDLGFGLFLGAFLMILVFLVELAMGWVSVTDFFVAREGGMPFFPGIILLSRRPPLRPRLHPDRRARYSLWCAYDVEFLPGERLRLSCQRDGV